jgi:hypothetical protein
MLPILEAQNKRDFHDLVTGDESWFMLEYEHEAQWAVSREKVAPRVRPNFQSPKFMFTIIWGIADFHVTNLMTSQRNFNSEYFINEIMQPLIAKLFLGGEYDILIGLSSTLTIAESIFQSIHKSFLTIIPFFVFCNRLTHRI